MMQTASFLEELCEVSDSCFSRDDSRQNPPAYGFIRRNPPRNIVLGIFLQGSNDWSFSICHPLCPNPTPGTVSWTLGLFI